MNLRLDGREIYDKTTGYDREEVAEIITWYEGINLKKAVKILPEVHPEVGNLPRIISLEDLTQIVKMVESFNK